MTDIASDSTGDRFVTLHQVIKAARLRLSNDLWDYLTGGADSETTLRRNRLALDALALRPRVLKDVSRVDCGAMLFGRPLRIPVVLAPIGSVEVFDPDGAAAAARAAARFGVPTFVSSVSQPGLEATAAAAGGRKIFQLYVRGDAAWVDEHLGRAADAGYEAFCLTVDTAVYSRRERDVAKRYTPAGRRRDVFGREYQAALNWDDVKRIKGKLKLPLIIKGIATAEDAERACAEGVDCIYVSNHGGRQLDHGRGAIEILPEVVEAGRGRAQIIIDGGFTRGTDVVKAVALGADAVGIGRLYCYGLAAAGAAGAVRVLELLETEIGIALGLLGVTSLAALDKSYLRAAAPVGQPHGVSAFPLIDLADLGY
jgi:isopentenyl diphosphate isomerase/L-lactate dehydrogenase-like FMN-dependent dehydrogenase